MPMLEVRPVKDKKDRNLFVNLMWKIYDQKRYPKWVPPLRVGVHEALDTVKNPFYKRAEIELFIAYQDGKPVGRIAAIDNKAHREFHKEDIGFYGFFECIEDEAVARALFDAAQSWCSARGLSTMRGPVNPSTNHECGLLVRGHSQHPTIMTTWNPKYYEALHEACGFKGVKDLVAYIVLVDRGTELPPRVMEHVKRIQAQSSNVTFRDIDMKNFDRDVNACFEVYNSAWEKNWGFFPQSREEFVHAAKDMKMILDPRMAFIAEVDGKPAGFMLAVPDINYILARNPSGKLLPTGIFKLLFGKKLVKFVRIITLGVKPEHRGNGIFALFTYEAFRRAQKFGYLGGEASWILEDNVEMNKPWQDLGCPQYRRWRIYERAV